MSTVITKTAIQAHLLLATLTTDQGTLLDAIGDAVQSAIEEEVGRGLASSSFVEGYDGNDRSTLYLRHDPVTAVSSVTRNGESLTVGSSAAATYPPKQVVWEADVQRLGALRLTDGSVWDRGSMNIVVSYTAGYATPPAALVRAGVIWSAYLFTNGRFPGTGKTTNAANLDERPKVVSALIAPFRRSITP